MRRVQTRCIVAPKKNTAYKCYHSIHSGFWVDTIDSLTFKHERNEVQIPFCCYPAGAWP